MRAWVFLWVRFHISIILVHLLNLEAPERSENKRDSFTVVKNHVVVQWLNYYWYLIHWSTSCTLHVNWAIWSSQNIHISPTVFSPNITTFAYMSFISWLEKYMRNVSRSKVGFLTQVHWPLLYTIYKVISAIWSFRDNLLLIWHTEP